MNRALFALGFMASAAYWPGMIDAAILPRWVVLAVGIPLCLLLMVEVASFPKIVAVLLAAAGVSLFWAPDPLGGVDELSHLFILAGAVWLGASLHDARALWKGVILGVAASAVIAVAQSFGWGAIPQAVSPAGLFENKNFLAEAAVLAIIAAFVMRQWALLVVCAVGLTLADSKAAYCALAVAAAVWLTPRRPLASWGIVASILTFGAYLVAVGNPSVTARLEIWSVAWSSLPVFGHGLGSFAAVFPNYEFAHNEPLQLVFELGLLSVPFFFLLAQAVKGWSHETELETMALAAIGTIALFSFPLHLPLTAFAAAVAAGRALGCRRSVVERRVAWRNALGVGA